MNQELKIWMADHTPTWLAAHDVMHEAQDPDGAANSICEYIVAKHGQPSKKAAAILALRMALESPIEPKSAECIYSTTAERRRSALAKTVPDRNHPLYSMNHITSDNPTAKDAADFIEALAAYVKEQKE